MTILLKLSQLIDALNRFVGKAVIWLILASTMISAINAVVRKIFHTSSNAYLEVQWYLFAWAFLLAAGYTLLRQEHVKIDVLYGTLKRTGTIEIIHEKIRFFEGNTDSRKNYGKPFAGTTHFGLSRYLCCQLGMWKAGTGEHR